MDKNQKWFLISPNKMKNLKIEICVVLRSVLKRKALHVDCNASLIFR